MSNYINLLNLKKANLLTIIDLLNSNNIEELKRAKETHDYLNLQIANLKLPITTSNCSSYGPFMSSDNSSISSSLYEQKPPQLYLPKLMSSNSNLEHELFLQQQNLTSINWNTSVNSNGNSNSATQHVNPLSVVSQFSNTFDTSNVNITELKPKVNPTTELPLLYENTILTTPNINTIYEEPNNLLFSTPTPTPLPILNNTNNEEDSIDDTSNLYSEYNSI